jgi:rubredoxin
MIMFKNGASYGAQNEGGRKPMKKYVCTICGYIYDPSAGDPEGGVKPGTDFADILDTWVCPICGAAKVMFETAD